MRTSRVSKFPYKIRCRCPTWIATEFYSDGWLLLAKMAPMTDARSQRVDKSTPGFCHCMSQSARCSTITYRAAKSQAVRVWLVAVRQTCGAKLAVMTPERARLSRAEA